MPLEEEQFRSYYYNLLLDNTSSQNEICYQSALSAVPFEFPTICESRSMSTARYVYGYSVSSGSFGAALGHAVKIDCLVKINAETLIRQGKKDESLRSITGCVDSRDVEEVMRLDRPDNPIRVFKVLWDTMPKNRASCHELMLRRKIMVSFYSMSSMRPNLMSLESVYQARRASFGSSTPKT